MNNNTELQKLLTEVAKNRILSGNYDKEMMETNLKVLIADMSITGEQYDYLIKLMYPVVDKLIEENKKEAEIEVISQ